MSGNAFSPFHPVIPLKLSNQHQSPFSVTDPHINEICDLVLDLERDYTTFRFNRESHPITYRWYRHSIVNILRQQEATEMGDFHEICDQFEEFLQKYNECQTSDNEAAGEQGVGTEEEAGDILRESEGQEERAEPNEVPNSNWLDHTPAGSEEQLCSTIETKTGSTRSTEEPIKEPLNMEKIVCSCTNIQLYQRTGACFFTAETGHDKVIRNCRAEETRTSGDIQTQDDIKEFVQSSQVSNTSRFFYNPFKYFFKTRRSEDETSKALKTTASQLQVSSYNDVDNKLRQNCDGYASSECSEFTRSTLDFELTDVELMENYQCAGFKFEMADEASTAFTSYSGHETENAYRNVTFETEKIQRSLHSPPEIVEISDSSYDNDSFENQVTEEKVIEISAVEIGNTEDADIPEKRSARRRLFDNKENDSTPPENLNSLVDKYFNFVCTETMESPESETEEMETIMVMESVEENGASEKKTNENLKPQIEDSTVLPVNEEQRSESIDDGSQENITCTKECLILSIVKCSDENIPSLESIMNSQVDTDVETIPNDNLNDSENMDNQSSRDFCGFAQPTCDNTKNSEQEPSETGVKPLDSQIEELHLNVVPAKEPVTLNKSVVRSSSKRRTSISKLDEEAGSIVHSILLQMGQRVLQLEKELTDSLDTKKLKKKSGKQLKRRSPRLEQKTLENLQRIEQLKREQAEAKRLERNAVGEKVKTRKSVRRSELKDLLDTTLEAPPVLQIDEAYNLRSKKRRHVKEARDEQPPMKRSRRGQESSSDRIC